MKIPVLVSLLLVLRTFVALETDQGGVCSGQLNNSQNITVVAAPGAKGEPGTEGPQGPKGEQGEKGVRGAPGKLGPAGTTSQKGDKGEQGPAGEKGDREQGPTGEKGAPGTNPPAPTTSLVNQPDGVNTVLTYDVILSNMGGDYNQETGKFVATVGGVYFFTFTGMTPYSGSNYFVHLMKNGAKMVGLYEQNGGTPQNQSSSNSAILQLQPGDEVWVELDSYGRSLYSDDDRYLTFSGFLIHVV
ncbi:complement C1q tumor necrosis factor-related protein 3-like [Branchiostoma floridae]|uniref:Complement C1q tumor necrosis factor-related protein 3-like n=1 Tax=Branchiostoma floridae TaxID=7739 RepID=A0A9J7M4X1_BRAFL|nr:complement C1q tumor necrosis factor-related protein 3-like [Branchiostoma floridae]